MYSSILEIPTTIMDITQKDLWNISYGRLKQIKYNLLDNNLMDGIIKGDIIQFKNSGNLINDGKLIYDGKIFHSLSYELDEMGHVPRTFAINEFPIVAYFSKVIPNNKIVWLKSSFYQPILLKIFDNVIYKYKTFDKYFIYSPLNNFQNIYLTHSKIPCLFCDKDNLDIISFLNIGKNDIFDELMNDVLTDLRKNRQILIADYIPSAQFPYWEIDD